MHFIFIFNSELKENKKNLKKKKSIVVVEDDRGLGEDSGDGGLNAEGVAAERVKVEVRMLEGLVGGITDVSGGAADEFHELVAEAMDPGEDNEAEEVVEVERLSGGVKIAVNFKAGGGGNNGNSVMEVRAG